MAKKLVKMDFVPGFGGEDYEYRFGIFTHFVLGAVYSAFGVSFIFAGMLALDSEKEGGPIRGKILAKFIGDCQDFTKARIGTADIDLKKNEGFWGASISIGDNTYDFAGQMDEYSRRFKGANEEASNSLIDLYLMGITSIEKDNFELFNKFNPKIAEHAFGLFMHFLCDVSTGKLAPQ